MHVQDVIGFLLLVVERYFGWNVRAPCRVPELSRILNLLVFSTFSSCFLKSGLV